MDVRQLELFLAVMEYGSVTRAAEKVYLSPGAISLQLHNLAAELQTELFIRTGKQFSPTQAAVRLREMAKEVVQNLKSIEHEFSTDAAADTRPFHLATGATTLIHRLGRPLRLLRKQFPRTAIQVTVSATEEMVAGILERRFDLAIITLPFDEANLEIIPVFDEELLIIRPSGRPVRSKAVKHIEPDELASAKFLLYPHRSNMRKLIERFFLSLNIAPEVVMEADDTEVIKKLVEAGFGYSVLPEAALHSIPRYFDTFRIARHPLARTQALAYAKTEYPRALTIAMAQFLASHLSSPAAAPIEPNEPRLHSRNARNLSGTAT